MAEHYRAGQLVNPFTVLRTTQTADGAGGYNKSEAQVGNAHLAMVRPLRGNERLVSDGLASIDEVLFVMWAQVDIRADDVLLYAGGRYNVRSIAPYGLSQFKEVTAELGVVNG